MIASVSVTKVFSQNNHKPDVQDFLTCSGWMGLVFLQISYSFKTLNTFSSLHYLEISLPSILFLTSVCDHVEHSAACSLHVFCCLVYTRASCLESIAYEMFQYWQYFRIVALSVPCLLDYLIHFFYKWKCKCVCVERHFLLESELCECCLTR